MVFATGCWAFRDVTVERWAIMRALTKHDARAAASAGRVDSAEDEGGAASPALELGVVIVVAAPCRCAAAAAAPVPAPLCNATSATRAAKPPLPPLPLLIAVGDALPDTISMISGS